MGKFCGGFSVDFLYFAFYFEMSLSKNNLLLFRHLTSVLYKNHPSPFTLVLLLELLLLLLISSSSFNRLLRVCVFTINLCWKCISLPPLCNSFPSLSLLFLTLTNYVLVTALYNRHPMWGRSWRLLINLLPLRNILLRQCQLLIKNNKISFCFLK